MAASSIRPHTSNTTTSSVTWGDCPPSNRNPGRLSPNTPGTEAPAGHGVFEAPHVRDAIRAPHALPHAGRVRRGHPFPGARDRSEHGDVLAVRPDAPPAAAGARSGRAGEPDLRG